MIGGFHLEGVYCQLFGFTEDEQGQGCLARTSTGLIGAWGAAVVMDVDTTRVDERANQQM